MLYKTTNAIAESLSMYNLCEVDVHAFAIKYDLLMKIFALVSYHSISLPVLIFLCFIHHSV